MTVCAFRPKITPTAPTLASISVVSASELDLSWSGGVNINSIQVWASANGGAAAKIATLAGTAASYPATGLLNNTLYAFYLVVLSIDSVTAQSNTESGTTLSSGGSPPNAPSSVILQALGTRGLMIDWTDNGGLPTGFKVYLQAGSATGLVAPGNLITTTGNRQTQIPQRNTDNTLSLVTNVYCWPYYAALGLTPGTTYYCAVVATNGNGDSSASASVSQATLALSAEINLNHALFSGHTSGTPGDGTDWAPDATNGPWILGQANKVYKLTENFTATGPGFFLNGSGSVIDLNGHTITYSNQTQPVVPDPYFESPSGNWDLSGAAAATVASISSGGFDGITNGLMGWATFSGSTGVNSIGPGAATGAQNLIRVTTAAPNSLVTNNEVRITGTNLIDGDYLVNVINSTTFDLQRSLYTSSAGAGGAFSQAAGTCLYFPPGTVAVQVVESANPITLNLKTNQEYIANVFARSGAQATTLKLDVLDAVLGTVITTTGVNTGVAQGYCIPLPFTLTSTQVTNGIKLKMTFTPASGGDVIYASFASVERSRDYGIMCSSTSPSTQGFSDNSVGDSHYPIQNQGYYYHSGSNTTFGIMDSAGGGLITAGTTPAYGLCVQARVAGAGSFIVGCSFQSSGASSSLIDAQFLNGKIHGNTFNDSGTRVFARQQAHPALCIASFTGSVSIVRQNTFINCKHYGIFGGSQFGGANVIDNNEISQKTRYTDGYAIAVDDTSNGATISNNYVHPVTGRGLMLDRVTLGSNGVNIFGNTVIIYEKGNLEYGGASLQACGTQFRFEGTPLNNLTVYNNYFYTHTDQFGTGGAIGLRLRYLPSSDPGAITITFRNNYCVAVTNDSVNGGSVGSGIEPVFYAAALSLDGFGQYSGGYVTGGLSVTDNILESNDTSFHSSDADLFELNVGMGITLTRNQMKRSALGVQSYTYCAIGIGRFHDSLSGCAVIGSTFTGTGNTAYNFTDLTSAGNPAWGSFAGFDKNVTVGWLVALTVVDSVSGLPVASATCVVTNNASSQDDSQTTDANGLCSVKAVTDLWDQPGLSVGAGGTRTDTSYKPHSLQVSATNYITQTVNLGSLTANENLTVHLVHV